MKKLAITLLAVMSLIFSISLVSAADPGLAQVQSTTDLGEIYTPTGDTVDLEAGNISFTNLTSNLSTYRWAGLFGTANGVINLGDSSGNIFYNWTGLGRLVYASTGASITWASLADFDQTDLNSYAALNFINGGGDADNYSETFTGSAEDIGSGIFALTSDYAATYNNASQLAWKTYSLWDTTEVVWAGLVNQSSTSGAYNGQAVDYQMIIPENGTVGNLAVTTYNLWLELQ